MGIVLVTGGTGFLGKHVARSLADAGEQVVITYRRSFNSPQLLSDVMGSRVRAARCDVSDLPELSRVIRDYGVDSIVHTAHISPYEGSLYQMMDTNIQGTINVMEAAALGSVKKVTYVSSHTVSYGPEGSYLGAEAESVYITSDGMANSACKKVGEVLSLLYGATFGIPVTIVRPGEFFGTYCESEVGHNRTLRDILEGMVTGKPVNLPHTNREEQFRLIYVRDCAAAISLVHSASEAKQRVYCINEEKITSWGEIAELVKEFVPSLTITFGESSSPARRQLISEELGITSEFGFRPKYGLKEGLREYIEWYQNGRP